MLEIKRQVEEYVEWQCGRKGKVIHSKPEQKYNELGYEITIWNVKTDNDGAWWVAQGNLPMNLYPQDKAYYFSTDEVFSFHMGLMLRMMDNELRKPERFVEYISNGNELAVSLSRKLTLAREKLQMAVEIEEIQAIGVMCRETLIELIGHVFNSEFLEEGQEPFKKSDVKNQGQVVIDRFLSGSENAEMRKHIRNLLNGAWDYANIITHSSSRTVQEASVCLTMTAAVVSAFEDLMDKYYDPLAGLKCKECGSRKLILAENGDTSDLLIICENCSYGFLK